MYMCIVESLWCAVKLSKQLYTMTVHYCHLTFLIPFYTLQHLFHQNLDMCIIAQL